jgi:Leucine-rich repeat (LRR) protein
MKSQIEIFCVFLILQIKLKLICSCRLENETCDCTFVYKSEMECLELSKNSILDMDLLNSSQIIVDIITIKNKNVSTLKSLSTLKISILNVIYNSIDFFDENSFKAMPNLVSLSLNNNKLKYIQARSFYYLTKLKYLNLFSNNLKVLKEFSFENLTKVETLYLYDNEIDLIETNAFYDLKSLTSLLLNGNRLKQINSNTFKHLTESMNVFYLDQNEINDIESRSFRTMSNLKYLKLGLNQLRFIKNEIFFNLKFLSALDLSQNEISKLDAHSFCGMNALTELKIQANKLRSLEPVTMVPLKNLKSFFLNNNLIEKIDMTLFKNQVYLENIHLYSNKLKRLDFELPRNLTSLNVDYNQITYIAPNVFENLTKLNELNIRGNRISEFKNVNFFSIEINLNRLYLSNNLLIKIEKGIFQNYVKLETLDLSFNYLDGFSEGIFLGLNNLNELKLGSNYIKILSRNFLNHLFSLKILNLNENGLKHVEPVSFRHLGNLSVLNLQSNKLSGLLENSTFYNLINLKVLNLNLNYFTSINESLKSNLKHLESLETLLMRNNLIEYLNKNDFEFNARLKEIDLNFNKIKFIHFDTFQSLKNLNSLLLSSTQLDYVNLNILNGLKMTKIDLSFNYISFDQFIPMDKLIEINLENVNFLTRNYSFEIFFSLNLKSIDLSNNNLSSYYYQYIGKMFQLETLELRQVGLQSMAQINFTNLTKLIKIDLSFNNLTQIPYESLAYMLYLEHLDLSFNRIDFIDERIFSPRIGNLERNKLKYLNLQSNLLVSVGDLFLNFLNLEVVVLSENYLSTYPLFDCESKFLIRSTSEIYLNKNRLTSIRVFSKFVSFIKILNFDSNRIGSIENDAFINLRGLENVSISNNFLKNLSSNNFFYLYNLKYLNLSYNRIESIESNTFISLNKLILMDLSFNRLLSIEPNLFRGLDNLEDLNLQSKTKIQLNIQSFTHLPNLTNLYLNLSMLQDYKCIFIHSIERIVQRKISNKYIFFKSLNILDSLKSNFHLENNECGLKFGLLQFRIHYNLKYDYENEIFYEECKRSLIRKENSYGNELLKCSNNIELYLENIKNEIGLNFAQKGFLIVVKDFNYLLTMGLLILLLSLVAILFLGSFIERLH